MREQGEYMREQGIYMRKNRVKQKYSPRHFVMAFCFRQCPDPA